MREIHPGGHALGSSAIVFVVGVSLMNAVAMMIIIPVLPRLVETFTGSTASAAHYVGLFATVFALAQFICAPLLGSLSDRFGRRTVILGSALGQSINFALLALAPNLLWLLIARIVSGITSGSLPAVNAYIADVAPAARRATSYGWIAAANAAGFLIGPALGGVLGEISPRLPFWAAVVLALVNALYGAFVLKESLHRERRKPVSFVRSNPVSALAFIGTRREVASLTLVFVMLVLAQQCMPNTIVLYTGYRFGWSSGQIGAYLTAVGVANILVQVLVLKPFVARFGERAAVLFGFICYTTAFLIYASAPVGGVFVLAAPFFALGGLVTPSVQAQVSTKVAPQEQGRLQGALAAITSFCGLFTPLLYTGVFGYAIGSGRLLLPPGTHIYLAAAFLGSGAMLAGRYLYRQRARVVAAAG